MPRINLFPSDEVWKIFKSSIESLNIVDDSTIDDICDGIQVFCWITFNRRLVKFDQTNPSFKGFHALRKNINEITVCEHFPNGMLGFDDFL